MGLASSTELPSLPADNNLVTPSPAVNESSSFSFVYALGRIDARPPRLDVEKELAQAAARVKKRGKTDREAFYAMVSRPENRYLARQLCWIFRIQGLDTYILRPRDPTDVELLLDSIKRPGDEEPGLCCVVGLRGSIAPPELCNGLMVPIVHFDQLYMFERASLIKAIPRPKTTPAREHAASGAELVDLVMQLTDNAGATDHHRALNYLTLRYPEIVARAAECRARNYALDSVEARPSRLSGTRSIVDVIFVYRNSNTDVEEKVFVRVDVTEEFPFLVTRLQPYYDRS